MLLLVVLFSSLLGGLGCTTNKKNDDSGNLDLSYENASDDALLEGVNTAPQKVSRQELEAKYKSLAEAIRAGSEKSVLDAAGTILFDDADDFKALNSMAMYYFTKKKVGLAKQYMQRALKKGNGSAEIHNNLGIILMAEGEQDQAVGEFKRSLSLDSSNVAASTNLGLLYAKYGYYDKAAPLLETANSALPKNLEILTAYAVSLRGTKNYSAAQKIYKGLVSQSDDINLLMDYAELLVGELKSVDEAKVVLSKIRFLDPRGEIVDRVIELERRLK
ncbi:MAG: hypothetical protein SGJ18_01950 [Pseudomonadota bacterium]|nr:hypothetical protein [Pseudomonadota bacterium]